MSDFIHLLYLALDKDPPAITDIGRHLQVEPMRYPPKQRSAKKSSLPVVQETSPVILPQDTTNNAPPPAQDDSPTRVSIHNNEYDSESDVDALVTIRKTT